MINLDFINSEAFVLFNALCLMVLIDGYFTYKTLKYYKLKGDKNCYNYELNPVVRWIYKTFGLGWGYFVQQIFACVVMYCFYKFSDIKVLYGLFGAFIIVILIHLNNWKRIKNGR